MLPFHGNGNAAALASLPKSIGRESNVDDDQLKVLRDAGSHACRNHNNADC